MKLAHLLNALKAYDLEGDPELEIVGLAYDSRHCKPGYLFVALRGYALNGHDYLQEAAEKGAVAVVVEQFKGLQRNLVKVRVRDAREALSRLASQFYNHPYEGMNLIGITGTNGKTTTSYLLESILLSAGAKPGVIGTINYRYLGETYPAPVTTPESLDLMDLLRRMADRGVRDVILEVSSHALDQGRTGGCPFRVAIFTNFSRDHLDYHHSMQEYFNAKSLLFKGLRKGKPKGATRAIINMDDPKGEQLLALSEAEVTTYGLGKKCDVRAESILSDWRGLRAKLITPVGETWIQSSLLGGINIYNILAASAAALCLNVDLEAVGEGIERLEGIPGRLERVENSRGLTLVVDYAHTPDALLKTLQVLRPLVRGRLITVFGCGGDRDRGKRSEMGFVAGQHSDLVFVTSDNPRTEDPLSIILQIEKGVQKSGSTPLDSNVRRENALSTYSLEVDRRKAIRRAISMADEQDLVLIAGKGHEDYQIVGHERKFFDDRKEAALAVSELGK